MCDRSINQGGPGVPPARLGRPLPSRGGFTLGWQWSLRDTFPAPGRTPTPPAARHPGAPSGNQAPPAAGGLPAARRDGQNAGIPREPAGPPTMAGPSSGAGLRWCPPHPFPWRRPRRPPPKGSGVGGEQPQPGRDPPALAWPRTRVAKKRRTARMAAATASSTASMARGSRSPGPGPPAPAGTLRPAARPPSAGCPSCACSGRRGRAGAAPGSPPGRGPGGGVRL